MPLKRIIKKKLEKHAPYLYIEIAYNYFKITGKSTERIATKTSDICVEGFPRCANSYTARAFRLSSKKKLSIATHMHSHVNILRALKLGIPTIVLIRNPKDAIISLRALNIEGAEIKGKTTKLNPIEEDIKWFINFYQSLSSHKGRFITGDFTTVTNNLSELIHKFNNKFKTDFQELNDIEEIVKTKNKNLGHHVFPTERRNAIKKEIVKELEAKKYNSLLHTADQVYKDFIQSSI